MHREFVIISAVSDHCLILSWVLVEKILGRVEIHSASSLHHWHVAVMRSVEHHSGVGRVALRRLENSFCVDIFDFATADEVVHRNLSFLQTLLDLGKVGVIHITNNIEVRVVVLVDSHFHSQIAVGGVGLDVEDGFDDHLSGLFIGFFFKKYCLHKGVQVFGVQLMIDVLQNSDYREHRQSDSGDGFALFDVFKLITLVDKMGREVVRIRSEVLERLLKLLELVVSQGLPAHHKQ